MYERENLKIWRVEKVAIDRHLLIWARPVRRKAGMFRSPAALENRLQSSGLTPLRRLVCLGAVD